MEDRKLCLIAWTIAILVLSGDVCLGQILTMRVTYSPQYLEYPSNNNYYDNNVDRGWLLQAVGVGGVHVNFTFFDIENDYQCFFDYVQLFDGSSANDASLGKFCGSKLGDFYSSRQSMYIKFHSDGSKTGKGFRLNYQAFSRWNVSTTTAGVCSQTDLPMTATFLSQQTLQYPANHFNYLNNVDCGWRLQTDSYDYVVHVTFTFVDIEYNDDCSYDYVQLFNGSSDNDVNLGKLCGSTLGDFYSLGQSMCIKFHSDRSKTGKGFRLNYQAVSRWNVPTTAGVCSRTALPMFAMLFPEQTLQYPANHFSYSDNLDCGWRLRTDSDDYVVHVTFTFVDIEYNDHCSYDYVQLFDGSSANDVSLGKLCGSTLGDFYSSGQSMYIKFHSDRSKTGKGFRLNYQAVSRWNVPTTTDSVSPAVIAGAVVGGVVFLMAVVVVIVSLRRHRLQTSARNNRRNNMSNTNSNQDITHPPNGSASNTGPISTASGPSHATTGPFLVTTGAVSFMPGPPSPTLAPPPYHLVCQLTGASYPGVGVNGAHTLSNQLTHHCQ